LGGAWEEVHGGGTRSRPERADPAVGVLADVMQRRWVDEPAIEHLPPSEQAAVADAGLESSSEGTR